jgi:hypothetical protein
LARAPLRHLQAKIGFGLPPAACRQRIFVTAGDLRNRPFDIAERHSAIAVMTHPFLNLPQLKRATKHRLLAFAGAVCERFRLRCQQDSPDIEILYQI